MLTARLRHIPQGNEAPEDCPVIRVNGVRVKTTKVMETFVVCFCGKVYSGQ
jgi:hypothetical protein